MKIKNPLIRYLYNQLKKQIKIGLYHTNWTGTLRGGLIEIIKLKPEAGYIYQNEDHLIIRYQLGPDRHISKIDKDNALHELRLELANPKFDPDHIIQFIIDITTINQYEAEGVGG
jgi:hypothetical protein